MHASSFVNKSAWSRSVVVVVVVRERERETETETETDRQRQRHRQTDRQTDREKEIHFTQRRSNTFLFKPTLLQLVANNC